MPVRYMVLAATVVAVFGALVILLVEVRADPEIEIPETALAEARAQYQRNQSARERAIEEQSMPVPAPVAARRTPPTPPPATPLAVPRVPQTIPEIEKLSPEETAAVGDERMARLREREEMRPEIRERREVVRQYYDEGNYEMALREARELIPAAPTNRYVLRVAITSACALGDKTVATEYYSQLFRDEDRRIVRVRCSRYGVEF